MPDECSSSSCLLHHQLGMVVVHLSSQQLTRGGGGGGGGRGGKCDHASSTLECHGRARRQLASARRCQTRTCAPWEMNYYLNAFNFNPSIQRLCLVHVPVSFSVRIKPYHMDRRGGSKTLQYTCTSYFLLVHYVIIKSLTSTPYTCPRDRD